MDKIELGQKLTVSNCLVRVGKISTEGRRYGKLKTWVAKEFKEPKEVIVVGIRTLSNGFAEYENEIGWLYSQDETFQAVLVVEKLSSKPFYINL